MIKLLPGYVKDLGFPVWYSPGGIPGVGLKGWETGRINWWGRRQVLFVDLDGAPSLAWVNGNYLIPRH